MTGLENSSFIPVFLRNNCLKKNLLRIAGLSRITARVDTEVWQKYVYIISAIWHRASARRHRVSFCWRSCQGRFFSYGSKNVVWKESERVRIWFLLSYIVEDFALLDTYIARYLCTDLDFTTSFMLSIIGTLCVHLEWADHTQQYSIVLKGTQMYTQRYSNVLNDTKMNWTRLRQIQL